MRRLPILILLLAGAVACVPATVELEPRGAVGVRIVPTAGSRGEPFVSADGWSIRVTTFAVALELSAGEVSEGGVSSFGGTQMNIDGSEPADGIVRALPAGREQSALVNLPYRSIARGVCYSCYGIELDTFTPEMRARFLQTVYPAPQCEFADPFTAVTEDRVGAGDCMQQGPNVWIVVEATRGDRRLTLDVALDAYVYRYMEATSSPLLVTRDSVVFTQMSLSAERIFALDDGVVRFDEYAAADADGDGRITFLELIERRDARYDRWIADLNGTTITDVPGVDDPSPTKPAADGGAGDDAGEIGAPEPAPDGVEHGDGWYEELDFESGVPSLLDLLRASSGRIFQRLP